MGNDRENKNGRRYTTFAFNNNKKKFLIYFTEIELFFILESKVAYLRPFFIIFTISQILKNIMYFGHKHVETEYQ